MRRTMVKSPSTSDGPLLVKIISLTGPILTSEKIFAIVEIQRFTIHQIVFIEATN